MKKIGIIMGSDSDLPIVQKAIDTLKEFEVPFEVHVYSAHRTPAEAKDFAMDARENGFGAIIAAAGMAAHLAGAMAANTTLPVIGIPVSTLSIAIPIEIATPIESVRDKALPGTAPEVTSSTCFFST